MKTLREVLVDAQECKVALGHFNISDSTQFNAIISAAGELGQPVLIGVSEGEAGFLGIENAVALVGAARKARGLPVFLNLDHTHSVEGCKKAIDAGFDAVMFDGSKLPLEENIEKTKEVVEYARASGRDVLVEGELGYIGSSSKLLDAPPEDMDEAMTTPELALEFVKETGVDLLAPSVGNLHGMLKGRANPAIDIDRIKAISEALDALCASGEHPSGVLVKVPLVLHGGSGISNDDFRAAIQAGVSIVHINTEIRVAYRKGIEDGLAGDNEQVAPYKYLNKGRDAVADVVKERIRLFANL